MSSIFVMYILLQFILLFLLIRNYWVKEIRLKEIDYGLIEFKKLPSYEYMLFKFWVWDISKFIKKEKR